MHLPDILRDALKSVYDPAVLSFALACGFIALLICVLDWVGTLLLGRSSLLGVGFGGWRRTLQSMLLWGFGAVLGAYLGSLVQLFDIESVNARVYSWSRVADRASATAGDGFGKPAGGGAGRRGGHAMTLVESLLGYRSFSSEPEIRRSVEQSKYYDALAATNGGPTYNGGLHHTKRA